MKDILKYVLIGGAGYLLWSNWGSLFPGASTTTTTTNNKTDNTSTVTTRALVGAYLTAHPGTLPASGVMNYDQWGWVYAQVRGVAAPAPVGVDSATNITIDEYFSYLTTQGLGQIIRLGEAISMWGR